MELSSRPNTAFLAIAASLAAALACFDATAAVDLYIGSASGAVGETVEVAVTIAGGEDASTVVFGVDYDPLKLEVVNVWEGNLLDPLHGSVFWQFRSPNRIEITAFNMDQPVGNGELCVIEFTIVSAASGIAEVKSWGSPSAASVSDRPIDVAVFDGEVLLNCAGLIPAAPTGLTATSDDPAGVWLEWDEPGGYFECRVYRAPTNAPSNVVPISGWIVGGTSFMDGTAAPPDIAPGGCSGGLPRTVTYYYWVRARGENGCPSDYSVAAVGSRDGPFKMAGTLSAANAGTGVLAAAALAFVAGGAVAKRNRRNNDR